MVNPWLADILCFLLTAANFISGYLLTRWLLPEGSSVKLRTACGLTAGLVIFAWAGLLPAFFRGLRPAGVGMTVSMIFFLLFVLSYLSSEGFSNLRLRFPVIKFSRGPIFYYGFWVLFFGTFYSRVLLFSPEAVYATPNNNFGDLPYHLNIISSFVYGGNFPPQDAAYGGIPYAYPFLADFLTAFFIYLGSHWSFSLFLGSFLLALAVIVLLEEVTRQLTANHLAAKLAPFVFIFSGGFDFISFFQHLFAAPSWDLGKIIAAIPQTYVFGRVLDLGAFGKIPLAWGDRLSILLMTQRSILFGIPLILLAFMLWRQALDPGASVHEKRKYWLAAGLITGFMPFFHIHAFLCTMLMAGVYLFLFYSIQWLWFLIPATILAFPQISWINSTGNQYPLFKPYYGWMAGDQPLWKFWLINNGIFILILLVQIFRLRQRGFAMRKFYFAAALLFILPNFFLMAPHYWDNGKVFMFWSLLSTPWVAAGFSDLFSRPKSNHWTRAAGALLLVLLTLSPVLYAVRTLSPYEKIGIYPKKEWEMAKELRPLLLPQSLTAHAPVHNSVMQLSGAISYLGYPGTAFTHGISDTRRINNLSLIYTGGPTALQIIAAEKIRYVLIGPQERGQYGNRINENFFRGSYPRIFDRDGYTVYAVSPESAKR